MPWCAGWICTPVFPATPLSALGFRPQKPAPVLAQVPTDVSTADEHPKPLARCRADFELSPFREAGVRKVKKHGPRISAASPCTGGN